MSISTFMGVETALRGLLAQQRALDITSHNIANQGTEGYTRQRAELSPTAPLADLPAGYIGSGVDVQGYTRMRDDYLDIQLRAQTMLQGYHDARSDGLSQVEQTLNEPSDNGLSALLSKYWSSWQDVANAPESVSTRQTLLQSGAALAGGLQSLRQQLTTIDGQVQTNIGLTIGDLNSTVADVAALNSQIAQAVASGLPPQNDLLDRRDVLVDKLSTLVNLTKVDNADGTVDLRVGPATGGFTLLSGTTPTAVNTISDLGANLTSGKLAGLVDLDKTIAGTGGYVSKLDGVASSLISSVNTLQAAGYTLAGTHTTEPFFTGTDAATIAINPNLTADPSLIAAAGAASAPGNGDQALAIASLRGSTSIDTAYASLVTTMGSDSQQAQRNSSNTAVLVDTLSNRRDSVSGVSIDEEMTNLIRFQRGYQAAARALTAMDDMIDQLINRTGKVGM